jgi:mortality factor 4-like protein 1
VPIPHPHPVDQILEDYVAFERPNRAEGSIAADLLDEVIAGLRDYFEKSLSRILLYRYARPALPIFITRRTVFYSPFAILLRFERPQYHEARRMWERPGEDGTHKGVCDTYGAEHLCRLLGTGCFLPFLFQHATSLEHYLT